MIIKKIRHWINKMEMAIAFAQANDTKDAKLAMENNKNVRRHTRKA